MFAMALRKQIISSFARLPKVFPVLVFFLASNCFSFHKDSAEWKNYLRSTNHRTSSNSDVCSNSSICICKKSAVGFIFHCEKLLHADIIVPTPLGFSGLTVECNETIQLEQIEDYIPSITRQVSGEVLELNFFGCPVDFIPSYLRNQSIVVKSMKIKCGHKKDFPIQRRHLQNLDHLTSLTISCGGIKQLPNDLFHGNVPSLRELIIRDTEIKKLPDALFSELSNLKLLLFHNNSISELKKENFHGIPNLRMFTLSEERLFHLDEDVFDPISNIDFLEIFRANITKLPKSFGRLQALEHFNIFETAIETVSSDDCRGLSSIKWINVENNINAQFHPDCLSFLKISDVIYFSGNALSALPNHTITFDNLESFTLINNKVNDLEVGKFISGNEVERIDMINSSISSMHAEFLHAVPNVYELDFSGNKLITLHEDFFKFNNELGAVDLSRNKLSSIFPKTFVRNQKLEMINISTNEISEIPPSLFANLSNLRQLDLSNNKLETIQSSLFANLTGLITLRISNNKLSQIGDEAFVSMSRLEDLYLDSNNLTKLPKDILLPFHETRKLFRLNLANNALISFPPLNVSSLIELNLANNSLENLEFYEISDLENLEILDLSNNSLTKLPWNPWDRRLKKLRHLDLSFNFLNELSSAFLGYARMEKLDLSHNAFEHFEIEWIDSRIQFHELVLSSNKLVEIKCSSVLSPLKILDVSRNFISSKNWSWTYDVERKTQGKVSPFFCLAQLEELYLAYNDITDIPMDLRNMLPYLRVLDLRYNKIKRIGHEDLLFAASYVREDGTTAPYNCSHSLRVDLRHNLIGGVDLPLETLQRNIIKKCERHIYSHATVLLDDNPFSCGCDIFKFLEVLNEDVVITSELWRSKGKDWVLPARIEPGNLSCSEPITLKGKLITEPETWVHHLLPMFGLCVFQGNIK